MILTIHWHFYLKFYLFINLLWDAEKYPNVRHPFDLVLFRKQMQISSHRMDVENKRTCIIYKLKVENRLRCENAGHYVTLKSGLEFQVAIQQVFWNFQAEWMVIIPGKWTIFLIGRRFFQLKKQRCGAKLTAVSLNILSGSAAIDRSIWPNFVTSKMSWSKVSELDWLRLPKETVYFWPITSLAESSHWFQSNLQKRSKRNSAQKIFY